VFPGQKTYSTCSTASLGMASLVEEGGDLEALANRIREPYLAFQNQVNSECKGRIMREVGVRGVMLALIHPPVFSLSSTCENTFPAPYGALDGSGRPILPVLNIDPPMFMRRVLNEFFNYLWGMCTAFPIVPGSLHRKLSMAGWNSPSALG
jgi:hypothetical protein